MTSIRQPLAVLGSTFQNPIALAAGTAGFGRELSDIVSLDNLGALITKSVSPEPRSGHRAPRVAEFPGGMLNAIGLANPGMEQVAAVELPWLEGNLKRARVIVSVVGSVTTDYARVITRLNASPVIVAFELNVSCPNTEKQGREFGADDDALADVLRRAKDATDRPVIAKLAPNLPDLPRTAEVAATAGADAFSVVNTIPGALLDHDCRQSRLGFGQGGVSGPALLPIGVLATRRVRERTGKPVIGVGGVRTLEDVQQYLAAGASLVAIGTSALADPRIPERIARQWTIGD